MSAPMNRADRTYYLWHNQRDRDPKAITIQEAFKAGFSAGAVHLLSVSDERFRVRAALEQLIAEIRPNLGTHDHTDWELARMVERAEAAINDE